MEDLIRALGALSVVLAAILATAWVLRRVAERSPQTGGKVYRSDLKIIEWRGVDARRKLAVVQWDGREHLICLSPAGDTLVASRAAPAPPPEAPANIPVGDEGATS